MATHKTNTTGFDLAFTPSIGAERVSVFGSFEKQPVVGDLLVQRNRGRTYTYRIESTLDQCARPDVRAVLVVTTTWPEQELLAELDEQGEALGRFARTVSAIMRNHPELRGLVNTMMGWK